MVKICHVTSVHDTEDVRICKKECVSLAQNGNYDVCIIGPGKSKGYKNVRIVGVGEKPVSRLKRMTYYAKHVINIALEQNADIYHLHDPELLRYVIKIKKAGKKVIFDSHENVLDSIEAKAYIPVLLRRIIKVYFRMLMNYVLRKVDAIIIVSPQMKTIYEKYNSNISLIPNFPIVQGGENEKTNVAKKRLFFAGGISEQWCHKEIIKAIDKIDGVEYYLFGSGENNYIDELKALSGWGKVHYGGKVPFEAVQTEMKKANIVMAILKPSNNTFNEEGTLGNTKLFEAMENSKPIIATNFKLWKDILEKSNCGICVDPNDSKEIENVISYMLSCSDQQLTEMGQNGFKIVKEKYNWDVCEKELYSIYRNIV